jgi:hypothetical protein
MMYVSNSTLLFPFHYIHVMGHAVAQLAEALRYKPEARGFDWNFLLTILSAALWPWDRNSL